MIHLMRVRRHPESGDLSYCASNDGWEYALLKVRTAIRLTTNLIQHAGHDIPNSLANFYPSTRYPSSYPSHPLTIPMLRMQLIALRLAVMLGNLFQGIAYFLRRKPQLVVLLQVHPDIRPRPKPLAEP